MMTSQKLILISQIREKDNPKDRTFVKYKLIFMLIHISVRRKPVYRVIRLALSHPHYLGIKTC